MLANLEIGLHEQTRLQPEIREAMDAALAPTGGCSPGRCSASSRSSAGS